jgi:phenylacetate-CoA ligase
VNRDLLRAYHALPAGLRSAAASAWGLRLRRWRYGPETDALIAEALERDAWPAARWQTWQQEALVRQLHRAATRVPYYRDHWQARRRAGDRASWEDLGNWPVLKKDVLREKPLAFVADDRDPRRLFHERTSGTTGTPLTVYVGRMALRRWYALVEARLRRWNGVSVKEKWAILGGQLVVPARQSRPPYWVFNAALNQLYLSTHHVSRETAPFYAQALTRYAPSHLVVYPSSAAVLASALLDSGARFPAPRVVLCNAEGLSPHQRATIASAFSCPVRNTYGMGEIVAGASECEKERMHWWPEVGVTEVWDERDDGPTAGDGGRLILTGLLNDDMPLIRYEIGDRIRGRAAAGACGCGRGLPELGEIEGRLNDLIVTRDGRRVFWINPVFYGLPVREAQVIQETLASLHVRVVPANGFDTSHATSIVSRLRDRVGETMEVRVEALNAIPREGGKFRAVISRVNGG